MHKLQSGWMAFAIACKDQKKNIYTLKKPNKMNFELDPSLLAFLALVNIPDLNIGWVFLIVLLSALRFNLET